MKEAQVVLVKHEILCLASSSFHLFDNAHKANDASLSLMECLHDNLMA